jgi:hypothetical protein
MPRCYKSGKPAGSEPPGRQRVSAQVQTPACPIGAVPAGAPSGPGAAVLAALARQTLGLPRERQRDKQQGVVTRRLSWPASVLAGGILLSLAANLAWAQPTAWARIVAAARWGAG